MAVIAYFIALTLALGVAMRVRSEPAQPITLIGFHGLNVVIGFMIFVVAAALLGAVFGISLLLTLLLHELGHVIGHQMLGHRHTRFQLAAAPISDHPHRSDAEVLFVALMGPGLCLAPMVLAHLAAIWLAPTLPEIATSFRIFAVTCGTVNFISLLPFWPLNGGRCARVSAAVIWPAFAPAMTLFMAAAFAAAAWRTGSLLLLGLAIIGTVSLMRGSRVRRHPLHPDTGVVGLAAYAFTLAAHFNGGWHLMSLYL